MPLAEYLDIVRSQAAEGRPFCIATVVKVEGAASAKTGSKAVFDDRGRNIFGWVGGGCAESFVGEQAVEALHERLPRTVLADLDDEIFGLGIACGGRMEVFIEPMLPAEVIRLPINTEYRKQAEFLAQQMGLVIEWTGGGDRAIQSLGDLALALATALGAVRAASLRPLREVKNPELGFERPQIGALTELKILGKGRIVESLARWGVLLDWPTAVVAPGLMSRDYHEKVRCECLLETFDELSFKPGSAVIVASHHAGDPDFVRKAYEAGAAYIGMVGSRKRALEVIDKFGGSVPNAVFVPTGLDIGTRTPEEIALSIVAEILELRA